MKYLITSYKNEKEKEEIQEKNNLYCYDLRGNDDGIGIATIEKKVLVNNVGSIITDVDITMGGKFPDNCIDYETFAKKNEFVSTIEELLFRNKTRQLDNNMLVLDVGFRNKEPIALVKRETEYGTEYIIGFNYQIIDNKIDWGYGYYYGTDINKATKDFKKVIAGGNLADTFNEKSIKNKKEWRER